MAKKMNSLAPWAIVAMAIAGTIFNTATLYNDVKHLKKQVVELKQDFGKLDLKIDQIYKHLLNRK